MKEIKLTHYNSPDKLSILTKRRQYSVILGNGVKKYFKNHKTAKKYLADTNNFLTYKLHELNLIYIDTWTYYRRGFWYFDQTKAKSNSAGLYEEERKLKYVLIQADAQIDLIIDRGSRDSGNYFVFSHFSALFDFFFTALAILKKLSIKRREYSLCKDLECTYARLLSLQAEIKKYEEPEDMEKIDTSKIIPISMIQKII